MYEPNMNSLNRQIKLLNLQLSAPFAPMEPELKKERDELVARRNAILNGIPVFKEVKVK